MFRLQPDAQQHCCLVKLGSYSHEHSLQVCHALYDYCSAVLSALAASWCLILSLSISTTSPVCQSLWALKATPVVPMQRKLTTSAAGYVPPQMSTHQSPSPPPASSHSDDFDTNGLQHSPIQGPSPPPEPASESQDQPHQQATSSLQQLGAGQESRAVSGSFSSLSVERVRVSSGSGGGLPDGIGMRPHHLQVSSATVVGAQCC